MKLSIREYQVKDMDSLAILTSQLGYPTTIEEMSLRMSHITKQANCRTIIAEFDGKVVGYIGVVKSPFWEQNGHYIRIQALIVDSDYRNSGIGKALINYAESWGREVGAKLIALNCGNRPERENAHKFYTAMGFEAKSTGYRKQID